ncbi:MAG TPA: hypothetical protein VGL77_06875 [Armatimonadota bacterium]|jgi:hypothetical protein
MKYLVLLLALVLGGVSAGAAELPITDIALFSSGVGYFQRTGVVQDTATVQLSFKPEQINDLLKSMVLLDLNGGAVGAVTYGAKDPVSKTLEAFAVNITDNPSLGQLLDRLRGVRVELQATTTITGVIVGVETRKRVVKDETVSYEVLNLLTDAGLRSVRMDDISSIRILDERLDKELKDALAVVASGLDNQRKPVVITFTGTGARHVVVGYLNATPVWKTSYRLVFSKENKAQALLQGWAIVENTSDADWTNVRLSLISGRPISFIQDLYTPLYIARPVVQPQMIASIGRVHYDAGGVDGIVDAEITDGVMARAMPQKSENRAAAAAPTPPMYASDFDMAGAGRASVASAATASKLGEAFQYAIKDPVTLARQKSAMLPIVTDDVDAWKVSIYNANVQPKFPLYGLRVKNTTGLHLMGGPITVYNDNNYAGDATFEDLQPGEQRLISYAIDLGVACDRQEDAQRQEVLAIKIVKGSLSVTRKSLREVNYTFAVKDGTDRKLMVEHAYIPGWTLAEPAKADERTDTLYRFNLPVSGKDGAKLKVVEEHIDLQALYLTSLNTPTLVGYIKTGKMSDAVREALQKVATLQGQLQDLVTQRQLREQEIRTISDEQNRLRQNMNTLDRASDLYKRYVTKLGEQETRIETLRTEIADLQQKEKTQRTALEAYVSGLNLE